MQVVAAVRGVCSGTAGKLFAEYKQLSYDNNVKDLLGILDEGAEQLEKTIVFVKENGNEYMDLYGRDLVDMAIALIIGYMFCSQASTKVDMQVAVDTVGAACDNGTISMKERKATVARRYIAKNASKIAYLAARISSGDKSTFIDYQTLVGPVPEE